MNFSKFFLIFTVLFSLSKNASSLDKVAMQMKAKEMFFHAYNSYMKYAFPADELMPLSCKGRYRDLDSSRGDIDDILGNFSLTLIDSLDTLFIMNELEEFERAVKLVISYVKFDSNVTVSVFEVNIRVVGGLLGAHVAAVDLKSKSNISHGNKKQVMSWYNDELLWMADDVAKRLLPAFNTHTGIPYPRINLRYGTVSGEALNDVSTCTACAGTIILEFAALSRFTGNPIYEEKAAKAMTYLWEQRNRYSDLMGTIINIHDGNWMRKESGVGAGIDSYYEYLLKAYVLLGDDTYLHRFNTHYRAIQRYISTSELSSLPLFLDVKMHQPLQRSKNFMDSLLAFWPGLQVLFGDIKEAIAFHEVLSQVMKRHNFLPEAFTTDFHVYWGHHLLRPEFIESNYFLYHSTGDPYYLDIGALVLNNLETHARVKCGFAAIQDVRTMNNSDQMDSYVLAETFKYLYLLYSEPEHLPINLDKYIFTTEGHILPLNLALTPLYKHLNISLSNLDLNATKSMLNNTSKSNVEISRLNGIKSCENHIHNADTKIIIKWVFLNFNNDSEPFYKTSVQHRAALIRLPLKDIVIRGGNLLFKQNNDQSTIPLLPKDFLPNNPEHINILRKMGIQVHQLTDGRLQLFHQPNMAESIVWSSIGENFMTEMMKLSHTSDEHLSHGILLFASFLFTFFLVRYKPSNSVETRFLSIILNDSYVIKVIKAAPAQFGKFPSHTAEIIGLVGKTVIGEPLNSCSPVVNSDEATNKIVIAKRGDCMFIEKARHIQKAGAIGAVITDHVEGSSFENSALFSMSGDGTDDIDIPVVFIFYKEAQILFNLLEIHGSSKLSLLISDKLLSLNDVHSYLEKVKIKPQVNEDVTIKGKSKEKEDFSQQAHSRIDMHFTNLKKDDGEPKTITDVQRVYLMRVKEREFDNLDQFLIRIYPNDLLFSRFGHIDSEPVVFYDTVTEYFSNYTNLDELEQKQSFLQLIRWAIFFHNNIESQSLPVSCHLAIDTLSVIESHLLSQRFQNRSDSALPSVTNHAVSLDMYIFLPDECQSESEIKSHDKSSTSDNFTEDTSKSDSS